MKTQDSNRVNMINANITYCDANTAATAAISLFATTLAAVKAKMVLVNSFNQIADGTTKGVTLDTNALRKAMTDLALKCANATLAFANATNNNTLAALVNYSERKLNGMKKEEVDDACEAIHDAANANVADVTDYGVSATDVSDLQAVINLYRTASQNPRQAIVNKSQAKKKVTELVDEIVDDLLVGQLDKMANTLKASNADFVSGYKQSREVIDLGSTSAKIRGTVLDSEDVPLKQVRFTITNPATGAVVAETQTDNKGKYGVSKLPVGIFDLKWEKSGYATITEFAVKVVAGKEISRKIVMPPKSADGGLVTRQGTLAMGMIANIDLNDVGDDVVTVKASSITSTMRYYAASSAAGMPGATFVDVPVGTTVSMTAAEFAAAVGLGVANTFLNVQNMGAVSGEWRLVLEK